MFDLYRAEDLIDSVEAKIKLGIISLTEKPLKSMITGVGLIADERAEQITKHGRTVELDKQNNIEFQLIDAVNVLITPEENREYLESSDPPVGWDTKVWKHILSKPYKERLVIAGAFIAAEIDRIS